MERKQISRDDVEDVHEISFKLLHLIDEITGDLDPDIALSCILTTTANLIFSRANGISQALFYKNVFGAICDDIATRLKKDKEKDL